MLLRDCETFEETKAMYAESKRTKEFAKMLKKSGSAAAAAAKETPEQKAKREAYETRNVASNAAFMAAYRVAHPVREIVTGSPYQDAKEAWRNGQQGTDGSFDHWTSKK